MLVVQMASAIMTNPVDALIGLVMMRSLCWSSSQNLFSQNGSMTLSRRGGNSVLIDTLNMLCLFAVCVVIYIVGSYSFIRDSSFGMSFNEIRTFLTGSKKEFNSSSSGGV